MTVKQFFKNLFLSLTSKKFIAWIVGTILLFIGKLTPEIWLGLTGWYITANVAQKIGTQNASNQPTSYNPPSSSTTVS
jgi:hypothetical protein